MTRVLVTIDTELSPALHRAGMSLSENMQVSVFGRIANGAFGIGWLMDAFERHGMKATFFVDPMFALAGEEGLLADIVGPIVSREHDVQLHLHTEWLEWAKDSPVGGRQGRHIRIFSRADQKSLVACARELLERAGAPRPTAFRAGSFGANDDTLSVLGELGFAWDSSVNAEGFGRSCYINVDPDRHLPLGDFEISELPVSGLSDRPGRFRHAQICAISGWEMRSLLHHAARQGQPVVNILTHSFEMLSRDRKRLNASVVSRFNSMCRTIADSDSLSAVRIADLDPGSPHVFDKPRLAPNRLRTWARMGEQAIATWRYEHRLRPL